MGTSSSHPGPNSKSPLVPPHADAEPGKPLPEPQPQRFKQFRTSLGQYVQSGDKKDLDKSLKRYVQQATGGADVGPRRFGTAIKAGGALISVLSALQALQLQSLSSGEGASDGSGDTNTTSTVFNFSEVIGKPLDIAIQILADNLTPSGEDSDKIRDVIVHALSESLQNMDETFDATLLNEEIYAQTLVCFLSEAVFQDILLQSDAAFDKEIPLETLNQREVGLRETIKTAVDNHLSERIKDGIINLSASDIKDIQLAALKDVFAEWDGIKE